MFLPQVSPHHGQFARPDKGAGKAIAARLVSLVSARVFALGLVVSMFFPHVAGAAPITIAALGDSLTQGYGLAQGDGLVPRLQQWLRDRGRDVTVINAGVSGDTTAGGLARLGWTIGGGVDALIVALGGNDMLRGIAPQVARANLDRLLARARSRGLPVLLVGLSAPANYGPAYKKAFDAIWPTLAAKYGTLVYPDLLAPLRALDDPAMVVQQYLQADGIHPNARGVKLVVAGLGPQVLNLLERVGK